MTVINVHIKIYLKVIIRAKKIGTILNQRFSVYSINIKEKAYILSIFQFLLKTFSITHSCKIFN